MAGRFPIYRTEKTLPGVGPSVTGRVNFDTGAGQMAAAIGRMGEAMFQVGGQMWQVQADQQFSEATAELRRKQNELQVRLETNPDEETYQEEMTRTLDEMENIPESLHLKNGLAQRNFALHLEQAKPLIENYVATKTKQRIDDKWWGTYYDRMAEAERTGNISAFESLGRSGIGTVEGMNEKVLTPDLLKVRHNASMRAAQKYAWFNPEEVLERLRTEGTLKEFPNLTDPDDWGRIRNYAVMRKSDLAHQQDQARLAEDMQLWNLLKKEGSTSDQIFQLIDSFQTYTPDDKQTLFKSSSATFQAIQAGRGNPLSVRQDGKKYWELYQGTVDGKVTEKDWRTAVNKGQITVNDYKEGVNIIHDLLPKNEVDDQLRAVKDLDKYLDSISVGDSDKLTLETIRIKSRRFLEDRIRESRAKGAPLTGKELDVAVLEIARRAEWELDEFESEEIYPTPGLNKEEAQKYLDRDKPQPTEEEFKATMNMLRANGWDAAAKLYYNKWIDVLWPK